MAEVYLGCGKHHRNSSLESSCRKKLVAIASISKAAEKYLRHCLFILVAKQSIVKVYLNKKENKKKNPFLELNKIFFKAEAELT